MRPASALSLTLGAARERGARRARSWTASGRALGLTGGLGLALCAAVIAAALLAPLVAPADPSAVQLRDRLKPPLSRGTGGTLFILGTDHLGRDVASRIVHGARVSLLVAGVSVVFAGVVGSVLGMLSGYSGGRLDVVVMRLVEIQLGLPVVVLAIVLVATLGPQLHNLIVAMAMTSWVRFARVVRAEALTLASREFVLAARGLGQSDAGILRRHVLPNMLAPIIVIATLEFGRVILLESTLSFLGLGAQPPTPSWGKMVSDARTYLETSAWTIIAPSAAIVLTVVGVNLLGDWVRERTDPTLRP